MIQVLLGRAKLDTTARYARVASKVLRTEVALTFWISPDALANRQFDLAKAEIEGH